MQGGPKSRAVGQQRPSNVGSCVVASIFLAFLVIIILILFFSVFKPRDPTVSVNEVQVPTILVSNAYPEDVLQSTVNFSMSIYFSVKNPNRAAFNYYDSTVQLSYYAHQIATMSLPAGKIMPGKTVLVGTTLMADNFRFLLYSDSASDSDSTSNSTTYLPVESEIRMIGRVNVLYFFTHHVEASAHCNNKIAVINGAVLSFHC